MTRLCHFLWKTQLFDLHHDPGETMDLAGDPAYAGEVKRLTTRLRVWQKRLDDAQPLTTDTPEPLTFDFTKMLQDKKARSIE